VLGGKRLGLTRCNTFVHIQSPGKERPPMPMIDVHAPVSLFPANADRDLSAELMRALLRAEGVINPGPTHTNNTGAYIHRLPPSAIDMAESRNGERRLSA
jgi:hypothetical protein